MREVEHPRPLVLAGWGAPGGLGVINGGRGEDGSIRSISLAVGVVKLSGALALAQLQLR